MDASPPSRPLSSLSIGSSSSSVSHSPSTSPTPKRRKIDQESLPSVNCPKLLKLLKSGVASTANQNCPELLTLLMSDLAGLTQPRSLVDVSARALAKHFNDNWDLPPIGWLEIAECPVVIHLNSTLFIRFLQLRGGIKTIYNEYSNVNFQRILKKLHESYYELPRLPLRIKSFAACQVNQFSMILFKSRKTEHAMFRLGIGSVTQLENSKVIEEGQIDEENSRIEKKIDFNHRLLAFYRNWANQLGKFKMTMPLVVPIGLLTPFNRYNASQCHLKTWILSKQERFHHADVVQKRPMCNFQLLQDFLYLNPTSMSYEILLAADTAIRKNRHHCAAFLSVFFLENIDGNASQIENIKIYIFAMLAVSLAVFNCRMDAVIEILRRMNRHVIFESDRGLVVLTKMKILQAYGYAFKINTIFEHIQKEKIFVKKSHYYFEALSIWFNALLNRCFNTLLELWLAKKERIQQTGETSQQREQNDKAVNDKAFFRIARSKNVILRLLEVILEDRGFIASEISSTDLIPEMLLRRSLASGLIHCLIENQQSTALRMWRKTIVDVPLSLVSSPYTELLRAFCYKSLRGIAMKNFSKECASYSRRLELKSDWSNNPEVANANFEMFTYLCISGLQNSAPETTLEVFQETLKCYQKISNYHQPHPRLVLLERINNLFQKKTLKSPASEAIGICGQQLRKNTIDRDWDTFKSSSQRACQHLNDLDALKWFILRDADAHIKAVITFGYNSVVNRGGT